MRRNLFLNAASLRLATTAATALPISHIELALIRTSPWSKMVEGSSPLPARLMM